MKLLKDILDKKNIKQKKSASMDKKSIESIFFIILGKSLPNITRLDIYDFKLKDGIIHLQTSHPAIAGEIWRKKENLKKKINSFLGNKEINKIIVK
jgi:hypothetical protein